jgi:hypothetical protein
MLSKSDEFVRWPTSLNPNSYRVAPRWRDQQRDLGVVCPQCERVRPERVGDIQRVVVQESSPTGGDFSSIIRFAGAEVLSARAVDVISHERLLRIGRLVPIISAAGHVIDTHVALLGVSSRAVIRGPNPDAPSICRSCGDLKYWPGWPPTKWYLLRRYWDERGELMLNNNFLLYSESLWKQVVEPKQMPGVKAHKVALVDEPTDGLPADFDEMITEIRRRG